MAGFLALSEHKNLGKHKLIKIVNSGMQLKDIARDVGVSAQTLSLILNTKRLPSLTLAVKLEDRLGIPPEDWLTERILFEGEKKNGKK